MKKPKIVVHCLVCNEERWIWYSLMSIIDYVDEIMVWDTGSTDATVSAIKSIHNPKIKFRQLGPVDPYSFTTLRQQMLSQTTADWLLLLDGDEIWTDTAINETINTIYKSGDNYEFLVHSYYNLVGDIYHFQETSASKYQIGPHHGNITIRAINIKAISGLHFSNPYGSEGLFDSHHTPIQNRKPLKTKLLENPYFHATHLSRSPHDHQVMMRTKKYKYELGIPFPNNFQYPKCFYYPSPFKSDVWKKRNLSYFTNSLWQTPLKFLKRKLNI